MNTKIIATITTVVIISMLIMLGPVSAFNFIISNIPDTRGGQTISFSVEVSDIDKEVDRAVLVMEAKGRPLDRVVCTIENDGSYKCVRFKGNNKHARAYNNVIINQTSDFGYGYQNNGDVTFNVTWNTKTNRYGPHKPGTWSTHIAIIATDSSVIKSSEKSFNIVRGRNTINGAAEDYEEDYEYIIEDISDLEYANDENENLLLTDFYFRYI